MSVTELRNRGDALEEILDVLLDGVDGVVLPATDLQPSPPRLPKISTSYEVSIEHPLKELEDRNLGGHIAVFPPFASARELPPVVRERHRGLDLHSLVFRHLVHEATGIDRLTILLPLAFFTKQRLASLRSALFDVMRPRMFIQFQNAEQAVPNVHPNFQFGLLTVVRGETDFLKFFRLPTGSEVDWSQVTSDFHRLLRQDGGQTAHGYVIREGLPPDAPLSFDLYSPDLQDKERALEELGGKRRLKDLVDSIFRGLPVHRLKELRAQSGIPVLHPIQITVDGLQPRAEGRDRTPRWVSEIPEGHALQTGDLCLRGLLPSGESLPVVEIEDEMLPLCPAGHVIVLRPNEDLPRSDRDLLKAFLSSGTAVRFLRAQGAGISIHIPHLRSLPVPAPDEALRVALASVTEAIESFEKWKMDAVSARSALFEFKDVRGSRTDLLSVGQISRRRRRAATLVEDHRHSIRTQYPHPVAYRWRTVEAAHPDLEGYIQVLECAETAAAFLAATAIATTRDPGAPAIRKTKEVAEKVASGRSGPSFGDWVGILRELRDSRSFRDFGDMAPVPELFTFLHDEEVDSALQNLSTARNELAHKKGPKGAAVAEEFESVLSDLEVFLQGIRFLSEYPLRYIESTKRDSLSGLTRYTHRDLMGDHPLVPVQKSEAASAEVEAESLYLVDRAGNLHLFRPILMRKECPECHRFATFILDRFDPGSRTATLVSLEHGHDVEDRDQIDAFRIVGLLT